MGKVVTLGGDRIGSEGKMKEYLHGYSRSSHDVGCIIATDQAVGTLVPYYCDIATNGTTYYIDMATKVRTLPTNGPLFGTFKHQLDWYSIPIRLYIGALHNNALGIGLKMKEIKLPKMAISWNNVNNKGGIAQDSLLAYLGFRDFGRVNGTNDQIRKIPGIFMLAYWDIYKNYYANKQEEIGYQITGVGKTNLLEVYLETRDTGESLTSANTPEFKWEQAVTQDKLQNASITLTFSSAVDEETARETKIYIQRGSQNVQIDLNAKAGYKHWVGYNKGINANNQNQWVFVQSGGRDEMLIPVGAIEANGVAADVTQIAIVNPTKFSLSRIDDIREEILATKKSTEYVFPAASGGNYAPYNYINMQLGGRRGYAYSQAGLGLKTYLSDRFNNWLSTEWIDGTTNGINEITAVDVSDGKLTMDALILSKKLFNMLNRIAVSGGSYNDWQEAVYGVNTLRLAESPMYCGGMSSEIVFDEVVANSGYTDENGEQALGSLAGRGNDKASKGGKSIKIRIEEPSMIMCIGSITPRVFYSQGNKWWNQLETMDDLHKPELDKIGFQELLTEEFAAFDSVVSRDASSPYSTVTYKSIGKQPSWIQYMTRVNESFGSFSAGGELEWMVLNRKYEKTDAGTIKDATTYIDPRIFNAAFADTKTTAKNFWVQVAFDITARRKMSAKQIPNL